jgi:hypothetical protein
MTNATVDTIVTSIDGQLVTVRYKGGEKKIVIRPETVILTYVAAERSELKPGASVTINGIVRAGGAVEARRHRSRSRRMIPSEERFTTEMSWRSASGALTGRVFVSARSWPTRLQSLTAVEPYTLRPDLVRFRTMRSSALRNGE